MSFGFQRFCSNARIWATAATRMFDQDTKCRARRQSRGFCTHEDEGRNAGQEEPCLAGAPVATRAKASSNPGSACTALFRFEEVRGNSKIRMAIVQKNSFPSTSQTVSPSKRTFCGFRTLWLATRSGSFRRCTRARFLFSSGFESSVFRGALRKARRLVCGLARAAAVTRKHERDNQDIGGK